MHTWNTWWEATVGDDSGRAVALRSGIQHTTLSRRFNGGGRPLANEIIVIARAYHADPVEGLLAAGYLTEDEVVLAGALEGLRGATDLQLAEEILRRVLVAGDGSVLVEPLSALGDSPRFLMAAKETPPNVEVGVNPDVDK